MFNNLEIPTTLKGGNVMNKAYFDQLLLDSHATRDAFCNMKCHHQEIEILMNFGQDQESFIECKLVKKEGFFPSTIHWNIINHSEKLNKVTCFLFPINETGEIIAHQPTLILTNRETPIHLTFSCPDTNAISLVFQKSRCPILDNDDRQKATILHIVDLST